MQGTLQETTLASVIRGLYVGRRSGILHVGQGDVRKRIYFRKGSIIFAQSDVNEDRLGEFLIRNGKLDRSAFDMAYEVQKQTGARFGRTVVELGHIAAEELQALVHRQVEAIIYPLFLWTEGEYRFEPNENPVDEDIVLELSTADIILEGTRRMTDLSVVRRALGSLDRPLRHTENPLLLYQKISLTPSEGFVLSRVDGATTLADLAAISPLGEDETLRCVYGLVSAGVLELETAPAAAPPPPRAASTQPVEIPRPEPVERPAEPRPAEPRPKEPRLSPEEQAIRDDILAKHASLETATLYDLLGVTMTASDAEIKKAYYSMAKKYHPDRHHAPYLQDVHDKLEELFVKITNAYHTLSTPLERRRYDASLRTEAPRGETLAPPPPTTTLKSEPAEPSPQAKMAETRYREGRRLYDEASYFDAIQCLRDAVRLDPDQPKYHRLLAKALMKNPHWRKDAEEHFQKALAADRFDVESLLGLAEIYEAEGMSLRAQRTYQKVLEYDPQNEIAREKLHGKKKGLGSLRELWRRTSGGETDEAE